MTKKTEKQLNKFCFFKKWIKYILGGIIRLMGNY
jgi:hypothetical protein